MSSSVLVDPGKDGLLAAAALVGDSLLAAGREPLDGGVGLDALLLGDGLAVGSLSIDLGNHNILVVDEVGRNILPGGGKVLAV